MTTFLLILISVAVAGSLVFYQYFYKTTNRAKVHWLLASLRFLAIFGLLLLLINPKITRSTYEIEETPLPLVVDNSASIVELKSDDVARELHQKLSENQALQEKFDVQIFRFDEQFESAQAFDFAGKQSNMDEAAKNLKSIYRNKSFPTVLITDGNQTAGNDFVYSFNSENKVYSIVLGDTTIFLDLRIMQVNVNKYAFHKNKFPVEILLQYSGTKSVAANFKITQRNAVVASQVVNFSPSKRSAIINMLLPANNVGLQLYKATLTSGEAEKNTYNNTKNFAVEVIDQRSEIAIVSAIEHPDISALKRAISSNAQRRVAIVKPSEVRSLTDYNVLVLYQPTSAFRPLLEANKNARVNTWIITGTATDYNLVNQYQKGFQFRMSAQREDYLAGFETDFNLFALDDIGFEALPPLQNAFGTVTTSGNVNVLLNARIRTIATGAPLMAFTENEGVRNAFLLGENIWKWRLQSHVTTKSFEKFDGFIDKTIQYLSSDNSRKSLVVNHESFYNSGEPIEITAQFFNKNYELDEKARLTISVTNRATKQTKRYDLLRSNNAFKVNLDGLAAGQYSFSVRELNSNTVYNGYFEILDFDIEKQFVHPDIAKLQQLAEQTSGAVYMPDQTDALIEALLQNPDYKTVQKEVIKRIPLIESIWLLLAIAILLASEWFIRKYNGMS